MEDGPPIYDCLKNSNIKNSFVSLPMLHLRARLAVSGCPTYKLNYECGSGLALGSFIHFGFGLSKRTALLGRSLKAENKKMVVGRARPAVIPNLRSRSLRYF